MADIRIKDLATTTTSPAADDYLALDGSTNGTRKMLGTQFVSSQTLTDNAIVRANGTAGQVQNSVLIVADTTGALSGFGTGTGITFHGGGTVTGASGSLDLTASGTNQNITLTPSGTGKLALVSGATSIGITALNASLATTNTLAMVIGKSDSSGNSVVLGWANNSGTPYSFLETYGSGAPLVLQPSGSVVLFGTTTDSSNGRIQLASHTTAAGGVGFGTRAAEVIYRTANDQIRTDADWVMGRGVIGSVQALTGAGAVNLTTLTTKVTSTAADALTLADGTAGQIKIITMIADGGDATLTPTTATGYTTIVFDAVGDSVTLEFHTTVGWMVVSNYNCTIA